MLGRSCLKALLLAGIFLPLASCNSPSLTSIVISPSTFTVTLAPSGGQVSTQFTATGYYTHPDHPAETRDITDEVTWMSYTPELVTINSSGVATATGLATGYTQIIASAPGFGGDIISNAATFTVNAPTTTTDVVSIAIVPANTTVTSLGATVNFTAIGTTGTGSTPTLTSVSWTSSNPGVATIVKGTGVATTVAAGNTTIVATYTNADGVEATGDTILTVQ